MFLLDTSSLFEFYTTKRGGCIKLLILPIVHVGACMVHANTKIHVVILYTGAIDKGNFVGGTILIEAMLWRVLIRKRDAVIKLKVCILACVHF